ncbi:MAG: hypothetical protein QXP45_03325 [Thermoproteota archaeon]
MYGLYGCLGMEKTVRKVGQHKNALLINLSGILPEDWRYSHVIITVLERGNDEFTIKIKKI